MRFNYFDKDEEPNNRSSKRDVLSKPPNSSNEYMYKWIPGVICKNCRCILTTWAAGNKNTSNLEF